MNTILNLNGRKRIMTDYIYLMVDDDLVRIKDPLKPNGKYDGESGADLLRDGVWLPYPPIDAIFKGADLTDEELTRFGVPRTDTSNL
jgi:hypothetical protein